MKISSILSFSLALTPSLSASANIWTGSNPEFNCMKATAQCIEDGKTIFNTSLDAVLHLDVITTDLDIWNFRLYVVSEENSENKAEFNTLYQLSNALISLKKLQEEKSTFTNSKNAISTPTELDKRLAYFVAHFLNVSTLDKTTLVSESNKLKDSLIDTAKEVLNGYYDLLKDDADVCSESARVAADLKAKFARIAEDSHAQNQRDLKSAFSLISDETNIGKSVAEKLRRQIATSERDPSNTVNEVIVGEVKYIRDGVTAIIKKADTSTIPDPECNFNFSNDEIITKLKAISWYDAIKTLNNDTDLI